MEVIKSKKIDELIKKALADLKKSHPDLNIKIATFDSAERFVCKEPALPFSYWFIMGDYN